MIELAVAFIVGITITSLYFLVIQKKKPLSVDEVLKRVDNELELAKAIPDKLLKKNGWQYMILPVDGKQNIRGVVTKVERATDTQNRIKRTRLLVEPIKGKGEKPEWADFFNKVRRELMDITIASGTALVTLAKKPNTDDDFDNVEWSLLPRRNTESLMRDMTSLDAMERKVHEYKTRLQRYISELNMMQADNAELKMSVNRITTDYTLLRQSYTNLKQDLEQMKFERDKLREENEALKRTIVELYRMLGVPADKIVGLDIDRAKIHKTQSAVDMMKMQDQILSIVENKIAELKRESAEGKAQQKEEATPTGV